MKFALIKDRSKVIVSLNCGTGTIRGEVEYMMNEVDWLREMLQKRILRGAVKRLLDWRR